MNRIGCAYHCRACAACFGSLDAFDLHRQFEVGHEDDWAYRICVEPLDDERFALKTGDGVCNLARPVKANTRIWTTVKAQRSWAKRKNVSRLTPPGAESDQEAA